MKLRFTVNQAESFRLGINAETSVTDLEVNPDQLQYNDRALIARHMRKGIEVQRINEHGNYGGLIEANAPTVEALLEALNVEEKTNAELVAAIRQREEERKAKEAKAIEECREHFAARKVKVTRFQVYANGHWVEYKACEPAFDTSVGGHVPGMLDWLNELKKQKQQQEEEAVAQDAKELEAKDLAQEARNLAHARFAGVEEAWTKGYLTQDGLISAVDDKVRAKYGLTFDDSKEPYRGSFNLTPSEIETAEAFRARLPQGAEVMLTGNRKSESGLMEPERIVIYANWEEQGSKVPASALIRDNVEDKDQDDDHY